MSYLVEVMGAIATIIVSAGGVYVGVLREKKPIEKAEEPAQAVPTAPPSTSLPSLPPMATQADLEKLERELLGEVRTLMEQLREQLRAEFAPRDERLLERLHKVDLKVARLIAVVNERRNSDEPRSRR